MADFKCEEVKTLTKMIDLFADKLQFSSEKIQYYETEKKEMNENFESEKKEMNENFESEKKEMIENFESEKKEMIEKFKAEKIEQRSFVPNSYAKFVPMTEEEIEKAREKTRILKKRDDTILKKLDDTISTRDGAIKNVDIREQPIGLAPNLVGFDFLSVKRVGEREK